MHLQEANVSTIKERAKKFPTVQTRKKFKVEILQKVPVCTAQVPFCSLVTDVCTAPRIVEKQSPFGFDRWLTWQVSTAQFYNQTAYNFHSILPDRVQSVGGVSFDSAPCELA